MIILQASLLGLLQTLTEIFPLSNAAHTILLQNLFGYKKSYLAYDVMIDCGVLLAFFAYFAKDILGLIKQSPIVLRWPFSKKRDDLFFEYPYARLLSYLLVSTLITAFVRNIFQEAGKAVGFNQAVMGGVWCVMGVLLLVSRGFRNGPRSIYEINHQDAFVIGLAQGFTVFPGIARFGAAFLAAVIVGLDRKEAARYSFLLGIPYIVCSIIYKFILGPHFYDCDQNALMLAFLIAVGSGVFALALVMKIIQRGLLYLAGFYCIALGIFAIAHYLVKSAA
jgi:undecaprenyl-diphosphatase